MAEKKQSSQAQEAEDLKTEINDDSKIRQSAANTPVDKVEFKGKYIEAIGRRKRSVARVRLFEGGQGIIVVNHKKISDYFPGEDGNIVFQPLKVTGHSRDFNFSVLVSGGGKQGQMGAVRLGISRALLKYDSASKEALKVNGFLTRDPRQVERKKPGLRKARKAPQWSKR